MHCTGGEHPIGKRKMEKLYTIPGLFLLLLFHFTPLPAHTDAVMTLKDGTEQQDFILKGRVVDKSSKKPLVFALVSDLATDRKCRTDFEGQFTLTSPSKIRSFVVSHEGYRTDTIKVGHNLYKEIGLDLSEGKE